MTNKRNWWRPTVSIKGLLVATAFCAVLTAWWTDRTRLLQQVEDLSVQQQQTSSQLKLMNGRLQRLQRVRNLYRFGPLERHDLPRNVPKNISDLSGIRANRMQS